MRKLENPRLYVKPKEGGAFIYAHYYRQRKPHDKRFTYRGELGAFGSPKLCALTYHTSPSGEWVTLLREAPFPQSDLIEHDINLPPKVNKP